MTGMELERDYTLSRQAGWFARVEPPPRTAPARYTREQLDALDPIERRRYDEQRAVWHANLGPIVTPQMQTLFGELDEIVQSNRQDGDRVRSAAVLSALPGAGEEHDRGSGRLPRADVEHDDAQPELGAVPVLRSPRVGEGQRQPAC